MSKRTEYWHKVADELMSLSRSAPTDADASKTLAFAYNALALSQCADSDMKYLPAEKPHHDPPRNSHHCHQHSYTSHLSGDPANH